MISERAREQKKKKRLQTFITFSYASMLGIYLGLFLEGMANERMLISFSFIFLIHILNRIKNDK